MKKTYSSPLRWISLGIAAIFVASAVILLTSGSGAVNLILPAVFVVLATLCVLLSELGKITVREESITFGGAGRRVEVRFNQIAAIDFVTEGDEWMPLNRTFPVVLLRSGGVLELHSCGHYTFRKRSKTIAPLEATLVAAMEPHRFTAAAV